MNGIRYLERNRIDTQKWDTCVESATNKLIYGYSWYLDAMAQPWAGLVLNDYEAVLPLPWRKKWGFTYVYTPHFCNPLGIFSKQVSSASADEFLQQIPEKFILLDLNLYQGKIFPSIKTVYTLRQNHVLDLSPGYAEIVKKYRTSYRQILNKREADGLQLIENIPVEDVVAIAENESKSDSLKKQDYERFTALSGKLFNHGEAKTLGVFSKDGELLASAIFFLTPDRIYYMMAGNTQKGREVSASHHLINKIIEDNSNQNIWLDFEGSDIPGIAFFFEGFGAKPEPYAYIHYNKLPWWCRWLKKTAYNFPEKR